MRRFLLITASLIWVFSAVMAQFRPVPVQHPYIRFCNKLSGKCFEITEGSKYRFWTLSGAPFEGKIRRIKGDSVFLDDGAFRVNDFALISAWNLLERPDLSDRTKEELKPPLCIFLNDTSVFSIILPDRYFAPEATVFSSGHANDSTIHKEPAGKLRHIIILVNYDHPKMFRIQEHQDIGVSYPGKKRRQSSYISRIRQDSVYIDDKAFRFNELDSIVIFLEPHKSFSSHKPELPGMDDLHQPFGIALRPVVYYKSRASEWKVIFPPESIYQSSATYRHYLGEIEKAVKRKKLIY
jgi:hypothetical protein